MKKIVIVGTMFPICQAGVVGDDGDDVVEGGNGEL